MRSSKLLRLTGVVCALVLLSLGTPPARGQSKAFLLEDKFADNAVRIASINRELKLQIASHFEGIDDQITKREATRQYVMQDWFGEVSGGKPNKLARSYDTITGNDTSYIGEQRFEAACADGRAGQTFVFSLEGASPKLLVECLATVGEKEIKGAAADNPPRFAPNKQVSVGDSWKVPAASFMSGGALSPDEKNEESEIVAALEEIKSGDGAEVAIVSVRATLKNSLETRNAYTNDVEISMTVEYSITGKAAYDSQGHIRAWQFSGQATAKGKMSGTSTTIKADFKGSDEFSWGGVHDAKQDNGSEGPEEVQDLYTAKTRDIASGNVVIARSNGKIGRLQEFDVANRKVVKTLAALPGKLGFARLALSKDRRRVAFRSTGNNDLSIAEANVFVLELESGKVNQLTPQWADNDGIAKALDTGKKGTITGKIVWYDDELRRDRSDGLNIGWVRVDHTFCYSTISHDGRFKLENVPVGSSLLLYAFARLPNYTNGKSRGWQFAPNACAMASSVAMLTEEGTKDIGEWKIHPPAVQFGYQSPCFDAEGNVLVHGYPGSTVAKIGYPKRDWEEKVIDKDLSLLTGAFSTRPDGKQLVFVRDSSGGEGAIYFYGTDGKPIWSTGLKSDITVGYNSESAWLADGSGCVVTSGGSGWLGQDRFGVPGLLYANPGNKAVNMVRKWPQLTGSHVASVALNAEGTVAYLVLHASSSKSQEVYGDLWKWDSTTDTLTRLTSLGDVIGVANVGR